MAKYLSPSEVKERWSKGSKAVRKQVTDLWMNSMFVGDEQWVAQNRATGGIDEIPRLDPERMQLTMNVLRPRSRGIIGRTTARPMFFQVRPRKADDASVMGAQIAQEVSQWYSDTFDWEELREDQAWVTWLGGTGITAVEWDPTAGSRLVDPSTGVPFSTSDGKRALHMGDVSVQVLNVAECCFEPGTRNAERALWWAKCVALPSEQVKDMFGLSETPKADAGAMTSPLQWRLLDSHDQQNGHQQLTAVYTYYQRPSGSGDGQVVVVVGEERVDDSEWPFPFEDHLNIAVTRETKVHGRWTGDTILTAARVPQMALNQSWSSIGEHQKRAGNARGWVNQATADLIEDLTDEPGEYGTYIGPEKPFWMAPPQMPSWWINMPDRLVAFIDEQLGSVEVARGVAPRNVESGLGLSILSENANTSITGLAKEAATAWGKIASMVLETLEAKVVEPRKAYFPEMPEYELPAHEIEWTGKDFAGQTRVKVPLDTIMPRSPAQVQAWAQAQLDRGAIDVRQFARLVQLPEQEHMLEIADPDAAKAQRENFRMSQGIVCIPAPFDNNKTHLAVLNAFRKTERYERLAPEVRELVDQHALAHEQRALDEAAKAAERMRVDPSMGLAATANEAPASMPGDVPNRDDQGPAAMPAGPQQQAPSPDGQAFFDAGQGGLDA